MKLTGDGMMAQKISPSPLATSDRCPAGRWGLDTHDSIDQKDCKRIGILTAIRQDEYSSPNDFLKARICTALLFQVNDVQIMQGHNLLSFLREGSHMA